VLGRLIGAVIAAPLKAVVSIPDVLTDIVEEVGKAAVPSHTKVFAHTNKWIPCLHSRNARSKPLDMACLEGLASVWQAHRVLMPADRGC